MTLRLTDNELIAIGWDHRSNVPDPVKWEEVKVIVAKCQGRKLVPLTDYELKLLQYDVEFTHTFGADPSTVRTARRLHKKVGLDD